MPAMQKSIISIHAPRTGSDHKRPKKAYHRLTISIHAPRTGSDGAGLPNQPGHDISIHAPRTGSDTPAEGTNEAAEWHFNPRSPHGERRAEQMVQLHHISFQSTLPARGATIVSAKNTLQKQKFQSTLPARGATVRVHQNVLVFVISIHAPRTGSDCNRRCDGFAIHAISIHAPRTGSDTLMDGLLPEQLNFNPRSPHGERRLIKGFANISKTFQSTLPARGATLLHLSGHARSAISIHAPRTGSDTPPTPQGGSPMNFNPRSPHGERLDCEVDVADSWRFQSTLPARGATSRTRRRCWKTQNFNPRSPHGERLHWWQAKSPDGKISIHAPRTGSDRLRGKAI